MTILIEEPGLFPPNHIVRRKTTNKYLGNITHTPHGWIFCPTIADITHLSGDELEKITTKIRELEKE